MLEMSLTQANAASSECSGGDAQKPTYRSDIMYSKILVPVDGSETSTAGLNEAVRLAKIHGSQLCLMHIVNEFVLDCAYAPGQFTENLFETLRKGGKAVLDAAEKIALAQGIRPTRVMVESIGGVAAELILKQAAEWHADVIVMGTHGRRGIFRLAMGSDAEQVVRGATIPVMLIRGKAATAQPATLTTAAA
jgi:nucleotide-binding universal stress UspA family protein